MPDSTFKNLGPELHMYQYHGDEVGDVGTVLNNGGDIDEIWLYPKKQVLKI